MQDDAENKSQWEIHLLSNLIMQKKCVHCTLAYSF